MREIDKLFNNWKSLCQNGSAPQINQAKNDLFAILTDVEETLIQMDKANCMKLLIKNNNFTIQ